MDINATTVCDVICVLSFYIVLTTVYDICYV